MESSSHISEAAEALRRGHLVIFPTETVYGLGAAALDPLACARIFEAKGRPSFNPLIVHIAEPTDLKRFSRNPPALAEELAERFWPGPLTLVVPKSPTIPDLVTAGQPTVALRVPAHPMARALLRTCGFPIAAPSANPSTRISPTSVKHLDAGLKAQAAYILDGGPCDVGVESTILGVSAEGVQLLRPGGIPSEAIEKITGPFLPNSAEIRTPGQMNKHYAPHTHLVTVEIGGWERALEAFGAGKKVGVISLNRKSLPSHIQGFSLSPDGDLRKAAANLFRTLHDADQSGLDLVLAELVPEAGLGRAINDRLRRASA